MGVLTFAGDGVQGEVGDDTVEPGAELGLVAELRQAAVGANERLLRHILCKDRIPDHAQRRSVDEVLMTPHHLAERTDVLGACCDELGLREVPPRFRTTQTQGPPMSSPET